MRQSTILTILIALVATAVLSAQKEQLFPHTKKQGKATAEYKHQGFKPGLWSLSQNSKIHRQNLDGFFTAGSGREPITFFSFPFERAISNEAIVDNDRVTTGALLIKSPEGRWQAGTYKLAIDNVKATAALPITLQ
jgi:hypothetical protein